MRTDTTAKRAAEFKARMAAKGLVQVNVWVPRGCEAAIKEAAEVMRAVDGARGLRVVNTTTGRIVSRKHLTTV